MSLPSKYSVQNSNSVSFSRNKFPSFDGWRKHATSGSFSTTVFLIREGGVGKNRKITKGGLIRTGGGVVGKNRKIDKLGGACLLGT